MSEMVVNLLTTFDSLPAEERREAAFAILRRAAEFDSPPLDDEVFAQAADETFLQYDADEARDANA